jgi:hypothetical protein
MGARIAAEISFRLTSMKGAAPRCYDQVSLAGGLQDCPVVGVPEELRSFWFERPSRDSSL